MSDAFRNESDEMRQRLSLLIDGESDSSSAQGLCGAWRDDLDVRATWHAYHLIGDVLRSEDLAHPVTRDRAMLAALRVRLAAEPVVLAPPAEEAHVNAAKVANGAPLAVPRRGWLAPVAVAAGFMAVAGVLVVTRVNTPASEAASTLAAASPPMRTAPASGGVPVDAVPVEAQTLVADGKLIRDARLERYLAAHKQYGGSSAVAVPGVVLRSGITLVAPSAER